MNQHDLSPQDNILELLYTAINQQGFLFQEACKYELDHRNTGWSVIASEYPVCSEGQDTRIDLILHSVSSRNIFAVVECKRADPTYSCWLFSSSDSILRSSSQCTFQCCEGKNPAPSNPSYNIKSSIKLVDVDILTFVAESWFEVKVKKEGRLSNPQNIENAFAQVLKGVAGFAKEQITQRLKGHGSFTISFIPIVITIASLYVGAYETKDINISTGRIDKDKIFFGSERQPPEPKKWVLVNYRASEAIAPSLIPQNYFGDDPKELLKYKTRSIFIINSSHITDFFTKLRVTLI